VRSATGDNPKWLLRRKRRQHFAACRMSQGSRKTFTAPPPGVRGLSYLNLVYAGLTVTYRQGVSCVFMVGLKYGRLVSGAPGGIMIAEGEGLGRSLGGKSNFGPNRPFNGLAGRLPRSSTFRRWEFSMKAKERAFILPHPGNKYTSPASRRREGGARPMANSVGGRWGPPAPGKGFRGGV